MAEAAYKLENPFEHFEEMFLKLRNGHYFGRLGKTFKTDKNFYFIDTGTGKIAELEKHVYLVLKSLFENDSFESLFELGMSENKLIDALRTIEQGVEQAHILSAPILETMNRPLDLEDLLADELMGLTLEVTQDCNLRCKYCIYHPDHVAFREFGKKHMSLETAKKAMDFLKEHSKKRDDIIHISFYGGEPLLNFEVVQETIAYAKEIFEEKIVQFALTTNVVLLTQEISDYFVENNVRLTLSIDGPKEMHDENRIFSDGKGSFEQVMEGVNNLVRSFEKEKLKPSFGINIVTYGSISTNIEKQYGMIQEFLITCDWFHDGITVMCNGVDNGPLKTPYVLPQSDEEKSIANNIVDVLGKWNDDESKDYTEYEENFTMRALNEELLRIHQRFQADEPPSGYFMNGCCVPGYTRGFVSVDGDIFPCERVGSNLPALGNLETGFDINAIKKHYVDDYIERSKALCKDCWAVNLCKLCYLNCYDEQGMDAEYRPSLCITERVRTESNLVRYFKISENNPELLKALDKESEERIS